MCLGVCRYYTTEFDWDRDVVTSKQSGPLSKFDKWCMGKSMCIEGTRHTGMLCVCMH